MAHNRFESIKQQFQGFTKYIIFVIKIISRTLRIDKIITKLLTINFYIISKDYINNFQYLFLIFFQIINQLIFLYIKFQKSKFENKLMQQLQSKLALRLQNQQNRVQKKTVGEDQIEDIYQVLTKAQSKNLMLIQFLTFLIQKGFIKNQLKLHYFMELYDRIKSSPEDASGQIEDEKFTKKKFNIALKQIAKQIYPCEQYSLDIIHKTIMSNTHQEDVRIKVDDNLKKIINKDIIKMLKDLERELQIIFEIYLPENFNNKLNFTWQEIKLIQKKLPIISVFRFLWDCQICPFYLTPTHFLQITSKLIPPNSLLTKLGQKQGYFYTPDTITNYTKDFISQKKIKLVEGDIGVSYFQFQMLLVRLSIDITKQKNDYPKAFQNLLGLLKLKEIIANKGQCKSKPNRFQQNVKNYFLQGKSGNKNSFQVQKRQTKKKIQQILQSDEKVQQTSRHQFKHSNISLNELLAIKRSLDDDHLPEIPQKPIVQKENNRNYKIQQKNIVIGEQLPKLPQKNAPVAAPKKNDKKDENINKFKFEQPTSIKLSTDYIKDLTKVPKKPRANSQVPIILMDIVYPNDIPNIYLNPKSEIYLQTAFIHLSQRSYEKAFINYVKAKTLCQNIKNQTTQFFFLILQAQIYQAAAHDGMALLNYHKAKELAQNMVNKDVILKYIAYKGLGCCLYHIQQYQYSLRCFLKARQLRIGQIELQSVENGVLQNNIGCIYMILNRSNQAMKHFALSQKIMDLKLGKFHQRSVIVQQNQRKNKKNYIEMTPAYKTMWRAYVQKPDLKPVKAPKKK